MRKSKLLHAFTMLRRNGRSYLLLSVTIVLSFALLLGYLFYMDTASYNKYKYIFAMNEELVGVGHHTTTATGTQLEEQLIRQAEALGSCSVERIFYTTIELDGADAYVTENGQQVHIPPVSVTVVPPEMGTQFFSTGEGSGWELVWLDGGEHELVTIGQGEAAMEEDLFYALGLDKMDRPEWTFSGANDNGGSFSLTVKIVALLRRNDGAADFSDYLDAYLATGDPNQPGWPAMLLSQLDCSPGSYARGYWHDSLYLYTDHPEEVSRLAEQYFGDSAFSAVEAQNEARQALQTQMQTKALLAVAILLMLGINLYSSFNNALNDRKFEIGVKRAIGASAWSIIRQFLYESILVMLGSTLAAVGLVTDGAIIYKYFYELYPNEYGYYNECVLYLSPYSIGMFAACALTLIAIFSLIFAWKSTRVEIVAYLKAE
ncbi:MAG: ABC transporter permease [Clostridiales bacterium]|nr:ABC transporter permease [Clostridiales bacterium]